MNKQNYHLGYAVLPIRFVQGWIFWGGGSRRFIYDPTKLDPRAHTWMANKFQSAMPGALLDTNVIINYLLQHFYLLYFSVIAFSLMELLCGVALISGFMTRIAAFISVLISVILMLTFGWQGATCMDEWTMAVSTLAMGATLTISGSPVFSLDNLLVKRWQWFSGELTLKHMRWLTISLISFTVIFTLVTYNYFRGSIYSRYHSGPVSAGFHHITLSDGDIHADGVVEVMLYIDGGTSAVPMNIIKIELLNGGELVKEWDMQALSQLPANQIQNVYAYNQIVVGKNGLVAPLSAKARLILITSAPLEIVGQHYELILYGINGQQFTCKLGGSS